jgi:hypothetical protein
VLEDEPVTLSGEQWLAQVFRPVVAAVNRVRRAQSTASLGPLGRLAAQVEALGDTGVLTDEQEREAMAALEDAGFTQEVTSVSSSASASARVGPAADEPTGPPVLVGVLAGPRRLGHLDGRPVTLISAELWSDRFLFDLYTDPGQEYRDRQALATRERLERVIRQRRGQPTEGLRGAAPQSPLQELSWRLRGEGGVEYRQSGGSSEAGAHLDRRQLRWSPAPPPGSERLTLIATDTTGTVVLDVEIPVPRPAT